MKKTESNTNSGGIGFCGLLTVAFIVLKLCNVIAWSWWWVLSPIWIPASALIVIIIVLCVVKAIIEAMD
jgi:hypothetical protein